MRVPGLAAVAVAAAIAWPPAARAEPRLEASGFVGVDWFGARSALGNSWAPEQVPGTAPVIGARLGWLALPDLPAHLQLAIEAELGFAPAFTGQSADHGRTAYFAPVFEWHGQAVLRLARWRIAPHLVLGTGGDSVASRSPFIARDTDPIAYWGPGLSAQLGRWQLRFDAHHGIMPARNGGAMSTVELELGLGTALGTGPARRAAVPLAAPRARPAAAPPEVCPDPRASPADGCAPPDPDGDGITGDADRCPDAPEDFDGWQDADGCPDPDNDGDGIADARDVCPDAPETVNGWQDADGCPDDLPAEVAAALATVVPFEPGHARVTEPAGATLQALRRVLDGYPDLRIAIIGHPERPGDDDLAHRRAEAVKWYLVDQGIAEDRLIAGMSAVAATPPVAFQLIPAPHLP
ncbi:MAG: OmpA family protein [Deltaproteobacteria bacterium]|nr:MAG: OmpA family protein [Deltaproteobacteria bacterium]